ncbi:MAG: M48 family metalloprotease [Acidobacteria bacterium]|nr:M48 family metalloprotease [Acidobacteriota bacterium]
MKSSIGYQVLITFALLGFSLVNTAFAQNPYDKFRERRYSNEGYLSEADEMKLGDQVHAEVLKQMRLVQDPTINNYVTSIGRKLARNSLRPNISWQFYVIDDKSVNAFATLGGKVYVHTGLLAVTQNEAQLASVLGHEIGHIVGRHGLENVKRANKYGTLAGIAQIAGAVLGGRTGASIGELAGNLIAGGYLMKHSRDAEREADYLGLYELDRSGYNTAGMVQMFETLAKISQSQPNSVGSILASHPPATERAQNTRREIGDYLKGTDARGILNTNDYNRIKGSTPMPADKPRRVRPRG